MNTCPECGDLVALNEICFLCDLCMGCCRCLLDDGEELDDDAYSGDYGI